MHYASLRKRWRTAWCRRVRCRARCRVRVPVVLGSVLRLGLQLQSMFRPRYMGATLDAECVLGDTQGKDFHLWRTPSIGIHLCWLCIRNLSQAAPRGSVLPIVEHRVCICIYVYISDSSGGAITRHMCIAHRLPHTIHVQPMPLRQCRLL